MDTKEEAANVQFVSTFIGIMSRMKTPEDLVLAYADLKQLESQVRGDNRASLEPKANAGEGIPLQSSPVIPRDDQGEPLSVIRLKDRIILKADEQEVVAEVIMASDNGRSLMLSFDATLFGIRGKMAVLREESGRWISVFGRQPIEVEWTPKES